MPHAIGPFDVRRAALELSPVASPSGLNRHSLDKTFHGPLDATSVGEMLSGGNPATGSAGYVAMERVTGTLDGKRGSFTLQHSATMHRGAPTLSIQVVPDSGTDELAGLSGSMQIVIGADKAHSYDFTYELG